MKDVTIQPKGRLYIIRVKVASGKWVDRSGGWRTKKAAEAAAAKIREEVFAEYQTVLPSETEAVEESGKERRVKSLKDEILAVLKKYAKHRRIRNTNTFECALNYLWEGLGTQADKPTEDQLTSGFENVRNLLKDSGLVKSTVQLYANRLRALLGMLPLGKLDPRCIAELTNLGHIDSKSESTTVAFTRKQMEILLEMEGQEDETTRLLLWIGLSGGPQIIDSVTLSFPQIDWDSGIIKDGRVKTDRNFEFAALPPLLELLKRRKACLGPSAHFVLPELVYGTRSAKPNTKPNWTRIPKPIVTSASGRGINVINKLFEKCGIKHKQLANSSFRKYDIQFWSSMGVRATVRMRLSGHDKEDSQYGYDVPSEEEILEAGDMTWEHLKEVREKLPPSPRPTVYNLNKKIDQFMQRTEASQASLHAKIDKLISARASSSSPNHAPS